MASGNDTEYQWTIGDVRSLDNRLNKIENVGQELKDDLSQIRKMLDEKKTIVVNPKTSFKDQIGVIVAVIVSVISGIGYAISLIIRQT